MEGDSPRVYWRVCVCVGGGVASNTPTVQAQTRARKVRLPCDGCKANNHNKCVE